MSDKNNNFEAWNEEMAKKYNPDKYHRSANLIVRFIEKKRTKWIIKFLNFRKDDLVIELGCGAGNIMEEIGSVKELWGVDLSDYLLEIAGEKSYQSSVKFIKGDIENLPESVAENKFDKIYCSEVLEHVQNPPKALLEIKKITKKNSIIVVSVPNEELINKIKRGLQKIKIFNLLFPGLSKKMDDEWHLHSFDLRKLSHLTEDKFITEKVKGIPYNWLPIRYIVKLRVKND